jgi:hypothetical protein
MSEMELQGKLSKAMLISREIPLSDLVKALAAEQAEDSHSKPAASLKLAKEDMLSALDDVVDII